MSPAFEDIPRRIFVDSSTLQALLTYGEFIYGERELIEDKYLNSDPLGVEKIEALRDIMFVGKRAPFQLAISENSFVEVIQRGNASYLNWAKEVHVYWLTCLEESRQFGMTTEVDDKIISLLMSKKFEYLGNKDRLLIRDAIILGCDTFLTMENKLPKQYKHIKKLLGISILTPASMWEIIRPWAGLFV